MADSISTQPIIIPSQDSKSPVKPKSVIGAISIIQQFFTFEKQGDSLPSEFFTLQSSIDFFKAGAKGAGHEAFFFFLAVILELFFLLRISQDSFFHQTAFYLIPLTGLFINTALTLYLSRFYTGKITRKAVNTLLSGRMCGLILKACFVYLFFIFIDAITTPERVWKLLSFLDRWIDNTRYYYDVFFSLKPFEPLATKTMYIIMAGAALPFFAVFLADMWRKQKIRKNTKLVKGSL